MRRSDGRREEKQMNTATQLSGRNLSWIVPTLYILFLLLPIYWLVNMSFKTNTEITGTFSLLSPATRQM